MKLLLRFLNWIGLTNLSRSEARAMTGLEWKAANDMTKLNRVLKDIADAKPCDRCGSYVCGKNNPMPGFNPDDYPLMPEDETIEEGRS